MPVWLIWLVAAGVLGSAEALSGDVVLIMCGAGAGVWVLSRLPSAPHPRCSSSSPWLSRWAWWVSFDRSPNGIWWSVAGIRAAAPPWWVSPGIVLVEVDDRDGRGEIYPAGAAVRVMQVCGAAAVVYDESFSS